MPKSTTRNGTLVTTLSVATKESWKNGDGVWQSHSEWHRVVLFGGLAEYARTLTKGSLVMVQGAVRTRSVRKFERALASLKEDYGSRVKPAEIPATIASVCKPTVGERKRTLTNCRCE